MNRFLLILSIVAHCCIISQERLYFESLSLGNNSEDEKILDFCLDKKGILWIGGLNGLYRYTGSIAKKYTANTNEPYSISSNRIRKIFCDSKSQLWICTSQGLNLFDEKSDKFKNFLNEPEGIVGKLRGNIIDITEDANRNCLWILDYSNGLYEYKIKDNKLLHHKLNHFDYPIFSKLILSNDHIYIGTSSGIINFSIANSKFIQLTDNEDKINCMLKYRQNIFYGTSEGFYRYNIIETKNERIDLDVASPNVSSIINKDEMLLIGCDGYGLKLLNPATLEFQSYTKYDDSQLNSTNITSLYYDRNKILWVGTYLNGINFSSAFTNYYVNIINGINQMSYNETPIVKAICYDDCNNIWIATDRNGIYLKRDNGYRLFRPGNSELNDLPISDLKWFNGNLHISTYGQGIYVFDTTSNRIIKHLDTKSSPMKTNNIRMVFRSENNEYWIASYDFGLFKIDSNGTFIHYNPQIKLFGASQIQKIIGDKYHNIWIASDKGLIRYDIISEKFELFRHNSNKNQNGILEIVYLPIKSKLYLGTNGDGLLEFDIKSKKFTSVKNTDLIKFNTINCIVHDRFGDLWIGSKNGICKFDTYKNKVSNILNETKGINVNHIISNTGIVTPDHKILFGTNKGMIQIDPFSSEKNLASPPILIEKILSFKKIKTDHKVDSIQINELAIDSIIYLNHDENDLEISFAALNFINPKGNKYKYKLIGIENSWRITSAELTARYFNIPPGEYEFIVHAANSSDIWNVKGKSFKLIVAPPWWKTWWFYIFVILGIIALILFIYYLRFTTIERYNKILEKEVEKKTSELQESNSNLKILLYKTSHDVKGPLKSLSTLAQLALDEVEDPTANTYLNHIFNSSQKIENIVEDLLTVTNPNLGKDIKLIGDFSKFVFDARESLKHIKGADRIKINFELNNTATKFYSCPKSLQSIIQNLIENPIKYQDYKKHESYLNIQFNITDEKAVMIFSDNGLGIPKDSLNKIFDMFFRAHNVSSGSGLGLYITKTVVERLKGTIQLQSSENIGSTFQVIIPNQPEVSKE